MKLTNRDIFDAREPMQALCAMKFPVGISFKLARLANKLNEPLKAIEDVRVGLVKKHGKTERGETTVPEGTPEYEKFLSEFDELMNMETELVIEKVGLADGDGLLIEPRVLMQLSKFVELA